MSQWRRRCTGAVPNRPVRCTRQARQSNYCALGSTPIEYLATTEICGCCGPQIDMPIHYGPVCRVRCTLTHAGGGKSDDSGTNAQKQNEQKHSRTLTWIRHRCARSQRACARKKTPPEMSITGG